MGNFVLLGVCFLAGVLLRRFRLVPENAAQTVNAVIIYVSLPGVALNYVHGLPMTADMLGLAAMGWIVFFAGWGCFVLLGRVLGWDRKTVACLTLTAALGNTSFVGLPMIEAFYGHQWMGPGLLADQAGTFMALCLAGIPLAAVAAGGRAAPGTTLRRVFLFPPFLFMLIALALKPLAYPDWADAVLKALSATLTPLALLSVGLTVRFGALRGRVRPLVAGVAYKMLLAPLLIFALYVGLLGLSGTMVKVTVFEAAMPPMVTGGIISMQHGLDPDLAGLLLGVGIPLIFATSWLWFGVLQTV
ncbi:MAG: AEC family transporter [Desulfovibrionaceae bacterium]